MTQNEPVQPDIDALQERALRTRNDLEAALFGPGGYDSDEWLGATTALLTSLEKEIDNAQQATITSQTKYMDTADEVMHKRAMLISKQAEYNKNLQSDNDDHQATITSLEEQAERLRTWLKAVEWVDGPGGYLRCPMCRRRPYIHDPQCNWVEDRAALGEGE